jgi:hypothetical protein
MSVQTERGSSQRGASSLMKIRESAEQLLDAINQAIDELPSDLEKQMDRIKEALLTGYAEEGIRDLGKTSNGNSTTRSRKHEGSGYACDKCDREFKNEAGLRIHYGRTHKRRRRPVAAGVTTPTSSPTSDASGVEFDDPDA